MGKGIEGEGGCGNVPETGSLVNRIDRKVAWVGADERVITKWDDTRIAGIRAYGRVRHEEPGI